ncbi:MAG: PD40 domain-containing protein [Candidatus Eremiobacteraeota bacterium]|nr:PD40 domain-containing protein [Candidatus Eremiobacteraeota bacterium]
MRVIQAEDLYQLQTVNDPQISPDGQQVLYVQQRVDRKTEKKFTNLWLVPGDGGTPRQFTFGDQRDSMPRWSPDGKQIAFVSDRDGQGDLDLHVMNIDGTGDHNVTNTNKGYWHPQWAPDGKSILTTSRDTERGNLELVSINADGSGTKQLTRLGYNTDLQTFSPDGEHIIFGLDPAFGSPVLCSVKNDGTDFHSYATDMILAGTPSVADDGRILFCGINSDYKMTIYQVELGKDKPAQRLVDSDFALAPTFSPDGTHMAWMADDVKGKMQIFEANADGSDVHQVTTGEGFHSSPAYTPDGNSLLYTASEDRKVEVYSTALRAES